jgi:lipoprotein signal peptidase
VFNLADAAIVVGMGLWLWESWARERRRASEI